MAVAWDGNRTIYDRANKRPDESRNHLAIVGQDLETECHTVNVRAVVGDNGQCQHHEAKLAKPSQRWEENGGQETSDTRLCVSIGVGSINRIKGGSCDGQAKHFGEAERNNEACICPQEAFEPRYCDGLVDGVIGRV